MEEHGLLDVWKFLSDNSGTGMISIVDTGSLNCVSVLSDSHGTPLRPSVTACESLAGLMGPNHVNTSSTFWTFGVVLRRICGSREAFFPTRWTMLDVPQRFSDL